MLPKILSALAIISSVLTIIASVFAKLSCVLAKMLSMVANNSSVSVVENIIYVGVIFICIDKNVICVG